MSRLAEPPLALTCVAGAAIIVLVGLAVCALLGWPFTPRRQLACAIIAGLFCLRAWQRRTGRLA